MMIRWPLESFEEDNLVARLTANLAIETKLQGAAE